MCIRDRAFPERSYDVGIAEAHAVTFSAGMAREGMIPFCVIYSSSVSYTHLDVYKRQAHDTPVGSIAL